MTVAWVVGSGGILGSALSKALRRNGVQLFSPLNRFQWDNPQAIRGQIAMAAIEFAGQVRGADQWQVYWAAGIGAMGSSSEALEPESQALSFLLQCLAEQCDLMAISGSIAFASSAGAIYSGSSEEINTELSPPAPTTMYGFSKLKQEAIVREFAQNNMRVTALIARISTIYGPGQSIGKQQGLITHIARRILRNQSIQIYVPYDTIRDYVAVEDAASTIVSTLPLVEQQTNCLVKIVASERSTTIAEVISIFKRITRRAPLIITSANKMSSLYARRIQFRSLILTESRPRPSTSLPIGIAQLMAAERRVYVEHRTTGTAIGR